MKGLSTEDASKKLEEHGRNELEEKNKTTKFDVFKRQFKNLMIWILIGAALASFLAGKTLTFYFIIVIIGIIILMGFLQEWKAEEAMQQLESMTEPEVEVYRDGELKTVPSPEIVPGDIIKLEMGDKIPADVELTKTNDVKIDEAILTGESKAVRKKEGDEAYSGTTLVHGRAEGKITATGMDSELGKIADEIQQEDESTPLQNRIDDLGKKLAFTAAIITTFIFALGVGVQGAPTAEILVIALALMVATVPEALPLTLTLTLSMGMREMADKNAIVKKMLAVESLGSTTVVCTDKTGTLTKNEMTIEKIFADFNEFDVSGVGYIPEGEITKDGEKTDLENHKTLEKLLKTGVLCNNSKLLTEEAQHTISGEPTEASLVVLGEKVGISREELEEETPREEEILFTSERKMMTTVNKTGEEFTAFSKGAPEVILDKCSHIMVDGKKLELTDEKKQEILEKNNEYADEALRVLALAYREDVSKPFNADNIEEDLTFLGLAGMIDPAREEVEDAIATCENAGIDVKMVTGDNPKTAKAIAEEIGLAKDAKVLTGQEIEEMSEEELQETVPNVDIYARTHPEHKLHIVGALKEDGEIVAMTGDGVNDAPAVKKADVGIGMGEKGTDVTKEASDMILEDDNFGTIVTAVKDGRRLYDNIEKFTTYLLSRNFTEIMIIAAAMMIWGYEMLPLIALQILFINVIGEELPSISLGLDPATEGIMDRPPRDPDEDLLNTRNTFLVVSMAAFMSVVGLIVFYLGDPEPGNIAKGSTMTFLTLVFMVVVHSFNFRDLEKSILKINPLNNKLMVLSVAAVLPMAFATIYLDFFATAFEQAPLTGLDILISLAGAIATLGFIEGIKFVGKKIF